MKPYYDEDGITIYHGDCRDILCLIDSDVVITDPPFGIGFEASGTFNAPWAGTQIAGDHSLEVRDLVLAQANEWACFGTGLDDRPSGTRACVIWDKGPQTGMGDLSLPFKKSWEVIYLAGIGWVGHRDEGIIKGHWGVTRCSMGRTHPNEKPLSLLKYLIGKHIGQIICDPFMGSGTTLRAAKDLGRKAIGIEIEERYCEIAARRLSQKVLDFK